jgi:hypothetical protein
MKLDKLPPDECCVDATPEVYGAFKATDGSFKVVILEDGVAIYLEDVPQFSPITGEKLEYAEEDEVGESEVV